MHNQTEEETVTTREFLRTFAALTKRPRSGPYTIVNHGKPVGTFFPSGISGGTIQRKKKQITLSDLERARFRSGKKNLSRTIDRIVYGA